MNGADRDRVENHVLDMEIDHSKVVIRLRQFNGLGEIGDRIDMRAPGCVGLGYIVWEQANAPSSLVVCNFYPAAMRGVHRLPAPVSIGSMRKTHSEMPVHGRIGIRRRGNLKYL